MTIPVVTTTEAKQLKCPKCGDTENHIETASISLGSQSVSAHGDRLAIPAMGVDGTAAPKSNRGSRVEIIFGCDVCRTRYALGFAFRKGAVTTELEIIGENPDDGKETPSGLAAEWLWRS
jgi:hypothetical protein